MKAFDLQWSAPFDKLQMAKLSKRVLVNIIWIECQSEQTKFKNIVSGL